VDLPMRLRRRDHRDRARATPWREKILRLRLALGHLAPRTNHVGTPMRADSWKRDYERILAAIITSSPGVTVAEIFRVPQSTIRAWRIQGKLPAFRLPGRGYRFKREVIEAFLNGSAR
jgi:excisionase family DNA binding protein